MPDLPLEGLLSNFGAASFVQRRQGVGRPPCGGIRASWLACNPLFVSIELPDGTNYLPPGRHRATVAEIESAFVDAFPTSERRPELFALWSNLSEAIKRVVQLETQWLDGSFVSRKDEPGDIDVVSHLDGNSLDALDDPDQMLLSSLVAGPLSKELFGCDSYWLAVYPEGHPARPVYEQALKYWDSLFGSDREGAAKGYIEVVGA